MKILLLFSIVFFSLHCSSSTTNPNSTPPPIQDGQKEDDQESGQTTDPVKTIRFAVISDLNTSYGSTSYPSTVKRSIEWITATENKIDFAISTGDMVAGQKSNLDYAAMWSAFHSVVTTPLTQSGIPLFPSPGNHDAHASRPTERKHYQDSWSTHNPIPTHPEILWVPNVQQNFPFQYAFTVGTALFLAMDSTTVNPWSDATLKWVDEVLSAKPDAQLKVIYGHVPLLPFAYNKETEYIARGSVQFLDRLEDLLETHKVDYFLSGHSHVYYPGRRDAHTQFVSVPLLGTGVRYTIGAEDLGRSRRGFLVFESDNQGAWTFTHRSADDLSLVSDESTPEAIILPSSNSSLCKKCSQFPSSHFLVPGKRIIYRRQDQ